MLQHQESTSRIQVLKHARALKRYLENIDVTKVSQGSDTLFPEGAINIWNCAQSQIAFRFGYCWLDFDEKLFSHKIDTVLDSEDDKFIARSIIVNIKNICFNPLSQKYSVGGNGYTHSIIDYGSILKTGLSFYCEQIKQFKNQYSDPTKDDFYIAMQEVIQSLIEFIKKCASVCTITKLSVTLDSLTKRAPKNFYEALVLLNLLYYIDGCDTIGPFDLYLSEFYDSDISKGIITESEVMELLSVFYNNIDQNNGWHMILGSKGVNPEFTKLCLMSQRTRRPNSGIKISDQTPQYLWDAALDCLCQTSANPAFYNDNLYRTGSTKLLNVADEDLNKIAYGGCTELMIAGKSNIGSIDSGINLLEILDGTIKNLQADTSYGDFITKFKDDIAQEICRAITETDLNQKYKALYRPQLIRSIFTKGCIESGVEYNAGGAIYNGGVINVAGISNTANSLYVIKQILDQNIDMSVQEFLDLLDSNFNSDIAKHKQLNLLPKFGNNISDVDIIAKDIT